LQVLPSSNVNSYTAIPTKIPCDYPHCGQANTLTALRLGRDPFPPFQHS